ncbi:MAG: hypothetical protein HF309_00100 [Ignavibacteria bacterium]|nr:hypothetical protein [Ignavibacteria bacterium]MCU7525912.1 hypothetical protein [Ignavibacteria bacterium]
MSKVKINTAGITTTIRKKEIHPNFLSSKSVFNSNGVNRIAAIAIKIIARSVKKYNTTINELDNS